MKETFHGTRVSEFDYEAMCKLEREIRDLSHRLEKDKSNNILRVSLLQKGQRLIRVLYSVHKNNCITSSQTMAFIQEIGELCHFDAMAFAQTVRLCDASQGGEHAMVRIL